MQRYKQMRADFQGPSIDHTHLSLSFYNSSVFNVWSDRWLLPSWERLRDRHNSGRYCCTATIHRTSWNWVSWFRNWQSVSLIVVTRTNSSFGHVNFQFFQKQSNRAATLCNCASWQPTNPVRNVKTWYQGNHLDFLQVNWLVRQCHLAAALA